jgi:hypothetical protein
MPMDRQVRERILRSLRWLVTDAEWRYNETKSNTSAGSVGGYSPELTEALVLLKELEQGELSFEAPDGDKPPSYTMQQCYDTGFKIGMSREASLDFYLRYARKSFRLGDLPGSYITNLQAAMLFHKVHGQEHDKATPTGKTKLFPLPGGKICSGHGCGMPAVLKVSGAYDFWYCKEHIPAKKKVKMREQGYDV